MLRNYRLAGRRSWCWWSIRRFRCSSRPTSSSSLRALSFTSARLRLQAGWQCSFPTFSIGCRKPEMATMRSSWGSATCYTRLMMWSRLTARKLQTSSVNCESLMRRAAFDFAVLLRSASIPSTRAFSTTRQSLESATSSASLLCHYRLRRSAGVWFSVCATQNFRVLILTTFFAVFTLVASGVSGILLTFTTSHMLIILLSCSFILFSGLNVSVINGAACDIFPTHLR